MYWNEKFIFFKYSAARVCLLKVEPVKLLFGFGVVVMRMIVFFWL